VSSQGLILTAAEDAAANTLGFRYAVGDASSIGSYAMQSVRFVPVGRGDLLVALRQHPDRLGGHGAASGIHSSRSARQYRGQQWADYHIGVRREGTGVQQQAILLHPRHQGEFSQPEPERQPVGA